MACECPDDKSAAWFRPSIGYSLCITRSTAGRFFQVSNGMRSILLGAFFLSSLALAHDGNVPASEVSLAGIMVGDSPNQVEEKLGKPSDVIKESDYLDTHYQYSQLRVSFSEGVVAGLYSNNTRVCTPKGLCVGDSLERMRALYGSPIVADRKDGNYYEYYGNDLYCWLQVAAKGAEIGSIRVACQP